MDAATETVGFIAALLTTGCYMPQVWHTFRTKEVAGISLLMYLVLFAGVFFWLIYGVMLASWPLITSNVITLSMIISIIIMKLRYSVPAVLTDGFEKS